MAAADTEGKRVTGAITVAGAIAAAGGATAGAGAGRVAAGKAGCGRVAAGKAGTGAGACGVGRPVSGGARYEDAQAASSAVTADRPASNRGRTNGVCFKGGSGWWFWLRGHTVPDIVLATPVRRILAR